MKRIFEFHCTDCNAVFSKLVRDDIKSGVPCKSCESTETNRIISATQGFQFKGSGFYETDYKNKS